jgi:hypothetical protein
MTGFFAGFVLVALCGCNGSTLTGYEFETRAVYVAEKSGVTVELVARGHVDPGADTGNGDVDGTISLKDVDEKISFEAKAGRLSEIRLRGERASVADPDDYVASFARCFESLGHSRYDAAEMEELERAIKACARGPKGTYMKGQTEHLRVDKTDFTRR